MKQKNIVIIISVVVVIIAGISAWYFTTSQKNKNITSYDECVAAGYPARESSPEQCAVPGGKTFTRAVAKATPISIEGRTVCLLHKKMDGPHTMECAMGIKADSGKYYGLGTDPYDASLSETNRRVRVEGIFKPDTSSMYQSEGTITVSSHEFLD